VSTACGGLLEDSRKAGIRDQGSGIRDQGSGIRDQGSGIRDQGSNESSLEFADCQELL
jgi:hypothetical protein